MARVGFHRGSSNADSYIRHLENHVVPVEPFVGKDFILNEDNLPPDTAGMTRQYLHVVGSQIPGWPSRSPHLNHRTCVFGCGTNQTKE